MRGFNVPSYNKCMVIVTNSNRYSMLTLSRLLFTSALHYNYRTKTKIHH